MIIFNSKVIMKSKIFLFLVLVLAFTSCKKEDPLQPITNIPGLGGDTWTAGPLDKWIYDSLTTPYNIAVKYKWDQSELQSFLDKTLVPSKEEQVIPLMSAIRKAWVNTYIAEAGNMFFKTISPKFFVLIGSPVYVRNAVILGTAEGGRKVVLTDVNAFRTRGMPGYTLNDTANVRRVFETIHHEFAHILDQSIKVPIEFSSSSAASYTSDWLNLSESETLNEGFISQYAISGKADDWAEMVSLLVVNGKPWFNARVASINFTGTTPQGTTAVQARARLLQKEAELIKYFKQAWNIDFYSLQARTTAAVNALLF